MNHEKNENSRKDENSRNGKDQKKYEKNEEENKEDKEEKRAEERKEDETSAEHRENKKENKNKNSKSDKKGEKSEGDKKIQSDNKRKWYNRILAIYTKLLNGQDVYKMEEADSYKVSEKTIQRDFAVIRMFLEDEAPKYGIFYRLANDNRGRFYLEDRVEKLFSGREAFVLCKMLLASRVLPKDKMRMLLDKMIRFCTSRDQELLKKQLQNEWYHYSEGGMGELLLEKLWELIRAIQIRRFVEIDYPDEKEGIVILKGLRAVGILFSENYFYLLAFREDEKPVFLPEVGRLPEAYRVDRIARLKVLEERFRVSEKERFEEGEFYKKLQLYMEKSLGKLEVQCSRADALFMVEYFPTTRIIKEEDGICTVRVEISEKGVDLWLRGR